MSPNVNQEVTMKYADWTDATWEALIKEVRSSTPTTLTNEEIKEIAWSYMHHGADGGGNKHGLVGTMIATCVDSVHAEGIR